MAVFTVSNVGDAGDGSLRQAIIDANTTPNVGGIADVIEFNIPGAGLHTIQPKSQLDTITEAVFINGYSQSGSSPNTSTAALDTILTIELDGQRAGDGSDGLQIGTGGSGSAIRGLIVNRFGGNGIYIHESNNNSIEGNFVGTDSTGSQALGNAAGGVVIDADENDPPTGAVNNQIGGATPAAKNLISANGWGISIEFSGASSNLIQGNFIGTDWTGTLPLGNLGSGVVIYEGATHNQIGGPSIGEGNLISGNGSSGIWLSGDGTAQNVIQGNLVGTDVTGTLSLRNVGEGIGVHDGAADNLIGGRGDGEGNLISGNGDMGVRIEGIGSSNNRVTGNAIGTDISGALALGNALDGVLIYNGATSNFVGGSVAGEGNLISANEGGVRIGGDGTDRNSILGNFIGTDLSGTYSLGNVFAGVLIEVGAADNVVGGPEAGAGNLISGNGQSGVALFDKATTGNRIQGNWIGVQFVGGNPTNFEPLPNGFQGVELLNGASNNVVGGELPKMGNTIAFNDGAGVVVSSFPDGEDSVGNEIRLNHIFSNGWLGVDLADKLPGDRYDAGTTPNDPFDKDEGPNNFQNYPTVLIADADDAGNLNLTFEAIDPTVSKSNFPLTVDVYKADRDGQEGEIYLGTMQWDGSGDPFTLRVENRIELKDHLIVVTATDAERNTSEFSQPTLVGRSELKEIGGEVIKGGTSAVEQVIISGNFEESDPDAQAFFDTSYLQSILITDDETIKLPLIETILVPDVNSAYIVHIAIGQSFDDSFGVAVAANEAHIATINAILTTDIDAENQLGTRYFATFWLDPVNSMFHDERGSFTFHQGRQELRAVIAEGAYTILPPRPGITPDGVQGYILYDTRPDKVRVELSDVSRAEVFRGGINFFKVVETSSGRSVQPYLQVVFQGYPSSGFRHDRLEIVFDQDQLKIKPSPPTLSIDVTTLRSASQASQVFGRSLIPTVNSAFNIVIASFVSSTVQTVSSGGGGSGDPEDLLSAVREVVQGVFEVVGSWFESFDVVPTGMVESPLDLTEGADEVADEPTESTESSSQNRGTEVAPERPANASDDSVNEAVEHEGDSPVTDANSRQSSTSNEWFDQVFNLSTRTTAIEEAQLGTPVTSPIGIHIESNRQGIEQALTELFDNDHSQGSYDESVQNTADRPRLNWLSLPIFFLPMGLILERRHRDSMVQVKRHSN